MLVLTTRHRRFALPAFAAASTAVPLVAAVASYRAVLIACVVAALAVAAVAALTDACASRIPDELVTLALAPIAALALYDGVTGHAVDALGAIGLGIAVFGGPLLAIHLVEPAAMGFGDVKLAVPLGATIGVAGPLLGIVALFVASFVTGTVGLARRRSAVPFGPGLVLGAVVAVALSSRLGEGLVPWR